MPTAHLIAATDHGLVVFARDAEQWRESVRGLSDYHVTCATLSEDALVAGTTAGVYRSPDFGKTWHPAHAGLTIPHVRWLIAHPEDGALLFAGTEPAALFVSPDGGRSWHARPEVERLRDEHGWYLPYSPEAGCVRGFGAHGQRIYAAVEQGGVLRSDDRGATWQLAGGSTGSPNGHRAENVVHPDVHSIDVHPSSPDRVTAATGGGLYRSSDGGRTWQRIYAGYCRAAWLDPEDPDHLLLGPADGVDRDGRIEETTDGGQSWHHASQGLTVPWPRHMVERFTQAGPEIVAVLSNGHVITSEVSSRTWNRILQKTDAVNAVFRVHEA